MLVVVCVLCGVFDDGSFVCLVGSFLCVCMYVFVVVVFVRVCCCVLACDMFVN